MVIFLFSTVLILYPCLHFYSDLQCIRCFFHFGKLHKERAVVFYFATAPYSHWKHLKNHTFLVFGGARLPESLRYLHIVQLLQLLQLQLMCCPFFLDFAMLRMISVINPTIARVMRIVPRFSMSQAIAYHSFFKLLWSVYLPLCIF